MTMRVPAKIQAKLLELVRLDTERVVLERAIADERVALAALETDEEYRVLVHESERLADQLDDVVRRIDHIESDVRAAKDRIAHDRKREAESTDSKELASLEHEIASLERRIEMLDEQELVVLAEREELAASYAETTHQRDTFHEARDGERSRRRGAIASHDQRLSDIATERAELTASLPGELVELYEKQRARYGVGASLLRGVVSTASGVTLTQGQLQEIRVADPDDVVLCPDSNAILIRTAESGL